MTLSHKQLRTLKHHLSTLFGRKGVEPYSFQAAKRLGGKHLWHELRLSDSRIALLTDAGLAAFDAISALLRSAQLVAFTEPADSIGSFRAVLCDFLSEGTVPSSAEELIQLVTSKLEASRRTYWQAVPVNGLTLEVVTVHLGCLTLERPCEESLELRGAKLGDTSIGEMIGNGPCLVGSVYGSEAFAIREFNFRVEVVIGVLAVVASVCFSDGANPFRITAETRFAGMRAARRRMSWDDESQGVRFSRAFMDHQDFNVDEEVASFLEGTPYVKHALSLAASTHLSELEEALLRGIFWFSDAQQDTLRVMQLVKYWSCAEVIFSGEGTGITKAVSEGVAAILVGAVQQEQPENFKEIVARLVALYELRCDAVHDARHEHVAYRDVATLSSWTAWMLLGVAGLIREQGYTDTDEVRLQSRRLAGVFSKSARGLDQ